MEPQNAKAFPDKERNNMLRFIGAHKLVSFLLVLLIIVTLWSIIKMNRMQKQFESEKKQLTAVYDSISVSNMKLTANVFSWIVREEMNHENLEKINDFFLNFIKEPGIDKIQLIDAPSAKVLLSTDKNEEGTAVNDTSVLEAEFTHQINNADSIVTIVCPVMGLNAKIATLVIVRKKIRP